MKDSRKKDRKEEINNERTTEKKERTKEREKGRKRGRKTLQRNRKGAKDKDAKRSTCKNKGNGRLNERRKDLRAIIQNLQDTTENHKQRHLQ